MRTLDVGLKSTEANLNGLDEGLGLLVLVATIELAVEAGPLVNLTILFVRNKFFH